MGRGGERKSGGAEHCARGFARPLLEKSSNMKQGAEKKKRKGGKQGTGVRMSTQRPLLRLKEGAGQLFRTMVVEAALYDHMIGKEASARGQSKE